MPITYYFGKDAKRHPDRVARIERRVRLLMFVLFPLWIIEIPFMWRDRRRRRKRARKA